MDLNTLKKANELDKAIKELTQGLEVIANKSKEKLSLKGVDNRGNRLEVKMPPHIHKVFFSLMKEYLEEERAALVDEFEQLMPQGNTPISDK